MALERGQCMRRYEEYMSAHMEPLQHKLRLIYGYSQSKPLEVSIHAARTWEHDGVGHC